MFSRCARPISPILYALLAGWCCSAIHAQSLDGKNQPNPDVRQGVREVRNAPSANTAAVMRQEMQASLQKLPWKELSPTAQAKIKTVVSGTPLFHSMPQQTVYADPEMCDFLIRHPDVVIAFWEYLGATQLSLRESNDNHYIFKETTGTAAAVEVLYRTNNLCIVYAKGEYRGPLLAKAYHGNILLVLRTQFRRDAANEPMLVCDLDTFVQINNLGMDVLAKLFFTSIARVADGNFEVTLSFVSQVSKAAVRNAAGLKSTAEEIPSIRQEVYDEFCEVVDRTAMRFVRRNQPTPFHGVQRDPYARQPKADAHDFAVSLKPPAHWEMDHFTGFPQPFYGGEEVLNIPKSAGWDISEETLPRLPKPER